MSRLLFATGQNSTSQSPQHFGVITAGSTIKAWHADKGSIHINQTRFSLYKPTCISITSTHKPVDNKAIQNQPMMAIGTDAGLIHLINLNTGELMETLRQVNDPTSTDSSKRAASVRDLLWSNDGSILYSVAPKHVFVWYIGNKMAQHKRLNIFGSLLEASKQTKGLNDDLSRLMNINNESLRRIAINHNQNKLALATTSSVFVYCLLTNSLLTKYHGFIGKPTTLSIDTPILNYTQQHHHDMVQNRFLTTHQNNDTVGSATEFFITVGTKEDTNAHIFQYPPVNTDNVHKVVLKKKASIKKKKTDMSNDDDDAVSTALFQICDTPTVSCALPAAPLSFHLAIVYDNVGATIPSDKNNLTEKQATVYAPIPSSTTPHLILSAATANGSAVIYHIVKNEWFTVKGEASSTSAIPKKSKKTTTTTAAANGANAPVAFPPLKTKFLSTPRTIVHDPSITNSTKTLSKPESGIGELTAKKALKHGRVGNAANGEVKVKVYQEGSINKIMLLNLAQVIIVRNSTLQPKSQIVQLTQQGTITKLSKFIYLQPPQPQSKVDEITPIDLSEAIVPIATIWRDVVNVDKMRFSANAQLEFSRAQDKLLFDAVKSTSKKGTNLLLTGGQQASMMRMKAKDIMEDDELEADEVEQKTKKQRLLRQTSLMNTSLRNILTENQDKIGLLALTPAYKANNNNENFNSDDQFSSALQGTLTGVLVQALKTNDDASLEYVIKLGVQGLNSNNGWSIVTRTLNNPETIRRLHYGDDTTPDTKISPVQTNANGIATINPQWSQQSGSTIAQTLISTVHTLPQKYVIPLVNALSDKLSQSPLRAFELLPWVHVLLRLHSIYFLSVPEVNTKLLQISNLLKQRSNTMEAAVQLKGRLEVIMSQFNTAGVNNNDKKSKNAGNNTVGSYVPLNVYSEDADRDQFHNLEDVEDDDFDDDLSSNGKKRKRGAVDNFGSSGLLLDGVSTYDDDDDEEDDEINGFDWLGGGEGEYDPDLLGMALGEGEYDLYGDNDEQDEDNDDVDDDMFDDDDDFDLSGDDL